MRNLRFKYARQSPKHDRWPTYFAEILFNNECLTVGFLKKTTTEVWEVKVLSESENTRLLGIEDTLEDAKWLLEHSLYALIYKNRRAIHVSST